jgi:hypothetical protein
MAAVLTAAIVLLPGPGFIPFIECNSAPRFTVAITPRFYQKQREWKSAMNGVHTVSLIRAVIDLGVTSRTADLPRHASEARCPVSQDQGGARSARPVLDLPRPSEGRRVVPRSCCRWSAAGSRLGPACLLRLRPDVPGCLALWVQRPKGATLRPDPRRECLRSGLLMRGVLQARRTTSCPTTGKSPDQGDDPSPAGCDDRWDAA